MYIEDERPATWQSWCNRHFDQGGIDALIRGQEIVFFWRLVWTNEMMRWIGD